MFILTIYGILYTWGHKSNLNKSNCKGFCYTGPVSSATTWELVVIGTNSTHHYRLPWCSLVVHLARSGVCSGINNDSIRLNWATWDVANTLHLCGHCNYNTWLLCKENFPCFVLFSSTISRDQYDLLTNNFQILHWRWDSSKKLFAGM